MQRKPEFFWLAENSFDIELVDTYLSEIFYDNGAVTISPHGCDVFLSSVGYGSPRAFVNIITFSAILETFETLVQLCATLTLLSIYFT